MNKRKDPRVKKKYMISFDDGGFDVLGLTSDLSKTGLRISSGMLFPPHREVVVSIAVPGGIFTVKGEVMWSRENGDDGSGVPDIVGIRITEAPSEYLNYVEYVRHDTASKDVMSRLGYSA